MRTRVWPIALVLGAITGGVAVAALYVAGEPIALRSGTALPKPRPIGDFELVDQHGGAFGPAVLKGHWSLVFTGFTHCPDICPTTLALLAALQKRLPDEKLQMVFVSVDPERDTPERLAGYLAHFGPDLQGATGTRAQVESFTARLGLAQVINPGVGADYTVDHSVALVLIDPRARVAGHFRPPHDLDALARDLAALPGGAG